MASLMRDRKRGKARESIDEANIHLLQHHQPHHNSQHCTLPCSHPYPHQPTCKTLVPTPYTHPKISPQLSPTAPYPVQAHPRPEWTRWWHPLTAITPSDLSLRLTRMSATPSRLPTVVYCCLLLVWSLLVAPCAAFCPSNCTCDTKALVVMCAPSNIDVLPITFFPALQRLTMYGTEIHILNDYSFFYYQDLRLANLSNNMIMQVSPETFKNQQRLEELHLAKNNIANITTDTFFGLDNLIVLSLRGNIIESVEAGVFAHLQLLEDLDLSENQIHTIEDEAMAGLSNLRVLHLHSNRLHTVPASNLELVPDLAELSLGGNEAMEMRGSAFRALRTLKDLDLSGTIIEGGLVLESFRGLSSLKKLNLEGCGLTSIPSIPLSVLRQLEELHIGQNLFVTLPKHAFRGNRNLRYLFVSKCPYLVHLETNVFENNLNIKEVIITENPELTYIAPGALRSLPELRLLDLNNNNLQHISQYSASWTEIKEWHLEGNPVSCNCSSAWLRTLLLAPNTTNSSVVCASPPRLAGTPLNETQLSDLACGLDSTAQGAIIGVVVCVLVVVIAAIVLVLLYRHHNSCVHRLVKGLRGRQRGDGGTTDLPYTYPYIYHPAYTNTSKAVPVTEL
ncbi:hypothetical protein Pcinc_000177 [Petrolisthes cinctipes]|uniref:LRRCT domain-containing protein n=1 Tax=Petrolisthes cinctipes TaxID=88211 RepID=A0AAE1GP17_PETCI|nr:hypothetical protein Pcinc_000177 [Petrolisthes cinctipes]